MKVKIALILFLVLSLTIYAQQTYVPDDNFEQALIDLGYDTVLDDYVTTANISGVTNLNITNLNITDLTGIEGFVALTSLNCPDNELTSLDLSQNLNLTHLNALRNQLTSMDITNNTQLVSINVRQNSLSSLVVTHLPDLIDLRCDQNPIGSLDVSLNNQLAHLESVTCQLSSLDVSNNPLLTYLRCGFNTLTSLDVSQNLNLTQLNVQNNNITSLDLSVNTALSVLTCTQNQLTELDLSQNTALTYLYCNVNQLTTLNVKNGNNTNVTDFFTTNNPNLTCIEVDNETYSTVNWTNIDTQTGFSEDCSNLSITDHEANNMTVYLDSFNSILHIKTQSIIEEFNIYTISGQELMSAKSQSSLYVGKLQTGIYLLGVQTETGRVTKRIVIK